MSKEFDECIDTIRAIETVATEIEESATSGWECEGVALENQERLDRIWMELKEIHEAIEQAPSQIADR